MKNKTINPTRSQFNILRQICNFIPAHEVSKIARTTGAEDKSRSFKPWSHVVSLIYAQLTHSIGLNDLTVRPSGEKANALQALANTAFVSRVATSQAATLFWPMPAATNRLSGEKMARETTFDNTVSARLGWTLQSIAVLSLLPLASISPWAQKVTLMTSPP